MVEKKKEAVKEIPVEEQPATLPVAAHNPSLECGAPNPQNPKMLCNGRKHPTGYPHVYREDNKVIATWS